MGDTWEQSNFGSLAEEASADFDGDGVPNVFEYNHLTNPTDPNSKIMFAEAQTEEFKYFIVDETLVIETDVRKKTILAAIQAANDFDVIEVLPGVYNETLGTLYDRLYIFGSKGARQTVITPSGLNDHALYLRSESVFSGLTFSGANPTSTSFDGGAIYMFISGAQTKPRFIGCLLSDNTVLDRGGAIYISLADPVFISCTIAGNLAGEGNGNAIYNTSSSNEITFINTLLWNPGTGTSPEIAGNISSVTYIHTLTRDDTTGNVLIDGIDQLTQDPGLSHSWSLLGGSPAIDSGVLGYQQGLWYDFDSEPRVDIISGLIDIGVDEFVDADMDGISDADEINLYFTNPSEFDSDSDNLSDYEEIFLYTSSPLLADSDNDQLRDDEEILVIGSNPLSADSDGDGMPDHWEANFSVLDILIDDSQMNSDSDTLLNFEEYIFGTRPDLSDSDADGLFDDLEVRTFMTDPNRFDSDNDGISDGDEIYLTHTNPLHHDSDLDKMPDGWEHQYGLDPLSNDASGNPDGDLFSNLEEFKNGSDPHSADSPSEMDAIGLHVFTKFE